MIGIAHRSVGWFAARFILPALVVIMLPNSAPRAAETPLVTGNGFGYGVVEGDTGEVTRFYAHPYRFMAADPDDPLEEGVSTPSLIDSGWWSGDVVGTSYLQQSHIIVAETGTGARHYAFAPFGLKRNVLVLATTTASDQACLSVEWTHAVAAREIVSQGARQALGLSFEGTDKRVIAISLTDVPARPGCDFAGPAWAFVVGGKAEALDAVAGSVTTWAGTLTVEELVAREARDFEAWRKPPQVCFADDQERETWRQSEAVLRMAQIREHIGHARGLINASLPNGEWFLPWTRDMAYSIVALVKTGHSAEARAALDGLLNARPVGKMRSDASGHDYQISTVRYFGDGSEENDHSGHPKPNMEFDSWGLTLWAIGEYLSRTGDTEWLTRQTYRGRVADSIRDYVVRPLLQNLEPHGSGLIVAADTSVWEQNDAPRLHYAASTIAAIAGLESIVAVVQDPHDTQFEREVRDSIALLKEGFRNAFIRNGHLYGTLEPSPRNEVDGAVLEAVNFGLLSDEAMEEATIEAMSRLKVPSGGLRRVTGSSNYERQEFLFINFNLARALLRRGRIEDADAIVRRMREIAAADANLFPEMYLSEPDARASPEREYTGEIGKPIGSRPMVGYGAAAFLIYIAEREELGGSRCGGDPVEGADD